MGSDDVVFHVNFVYPELFLLSMIIIILIGGCPNSAQ